MQECIQFRLLLCCAFRTYFAFLSIRTFRHYLKQDYSGLVGPTPAVYMTAVIEYVVAEVLDIARHSSREARRVSPRDIMLAIVLDEELSALFDGYVAFGGVHPGYPSPPSLLLQNLDQERHELFVKSQHQPRTDAYQRRLDS